MARAARRPGEPELTEGMRLLDRYSILDRIGSGGMATIYRATDDRLDRVVCVKLLRTTIVEGSGSSGGNHAVYKATYTHFLQEALALSKLSHPNTLRIYDFGYLREQPAGAPFHVSEYLDGGNLETNVRLRGPLPTQEAVGILDGICGAVAEAHEHGIIHRDIKPSNILFARVRGELVSKLADFGIARSDVKKNESEKAENGESVSTVALFSPRWAAPEQLCGSPEGPRTDVYALGLMTIFMLTGTVLFGDEDVRVTFNERVRSDRIVTTRLGQLGLGGDVARVLSAAMLARPEERIASAPDFAVRMREALKVRPPESVGPLHPVEVVARSAELPVIAAANLSPSAGRRDALALEVEAESAGAIKPAERIVAQGERRIRYVQVHEKLDLAFLDPSGGQVRLRVTLLPTQSASLNVKGLSCFVARQKNRPTPALTLQQDATIELVATTRQILGELSVSFGNPGPNGRVFLVNGRELLVTYAEAQQAVVLMLSGGNDLVVMCRS